jgi:hypothetical protein
MVEMENHNMVTGLFQLQLDRDVIILTSSSKKHCIQVSHQDVLQFIGEQRQWDGTSRLLHKGHSYYTHQEYGPTKDNTGFQ